VLKDHHEGYIDWAEFERNQKQLAANAYGRVGEVKSGRGGQALRSVCLVAPDAAVASRSPIMDARDAPIAATIQTLCSVRRVA
jgi:hypothetical protein